MANPMKEIDFWRQKLLLLLHDPPAKPFASYSGGKKTGGHAAVAKEIASKISGETIKYFNSIPDYASAGADRPLLHLDKKDKKGKISVSWVKNPIITHPLSPGYNLKLDIAGIEEKKISEIKDIVLEVQEEKIDEIYKSIESLNLKDDLWNNTRSLNNTFLIIWRLLKQSLVDDDSAQNKNFQNIWQLMPGDTRSPDHSIWDHTRVTSALAFLPPKKNIEDSLIPWFFKFEIGPVGKFIEDAKTSRDLWMGSFLLSDLIWHAMKPIVKHYGPDSIIYPDLRENPRVDQWLKKDYPEALPEDENPFTYAAVLPNTFTAIIPFGEEKDESYMIQLEKLALQCEESIKKRWKYLGDFVKNWIFKNVETSADFYDLWNKQHEKAIYSTWSCVKWSLSEKIKDPESILHGNALIFQDDEPDSKVYEEGILSKDLKALDSRRKRLKYGFITDEVYAEYEHVKKVYSKTNLKTHQGERGFDYALIHHQLRMRHNIRKYEKPLPSVFNEKGEICSVCGKRQAIYSMEGKEDLLHNHRAQSRKFWNNEKLNKDLDNPDRLCSICATKRFLVQSGITGDRLTGINTVWAGLDKNEYKDFGFNDKNNPPRVPFPSTTLLACQEFIKDVCSCGELKEDIEAIVRVCKKIDLAKTSFASSLRSLWELENKNKEPYKSFLEYDVQQIIFPETIDSQIRKLERDGGKTEGLLELKESVIQFRKRVREISKSKNNLIEIGEPNTSIAIVRMDGDSMGKLLLGDNSAIKTTWRDIIHPDAVEKEGSKTSILTNETTIKAGWRDIIDKKRLMGPSLHSFISRALAEFSHRIVPWVVEMEFCGRLIYSGGDDVLAMVPSQYAVSMTARLQQLFSAPYIIDTMPQQKPWSWRNKRNSVLNEISSRSRYLIPVKPRYGENISLPIDNRDKIEPFIYDSYLEKNYLEMPIDGKIIPMLGKGHSLSAGIAFGHCKNPLKGFLNQSDRMLNSIAKKIKGKSAMGISHFSRNGVKTEFVMNWKKNEDDADFSNIKILNNTIKNFKNNTLPSRLPYKLNGFTELIKDIPDQKEKEDLVKGLFNSSLEGGGKEEADDAFNLWKIGMYADQSMEADEKINWADGLFIARNLSSLGEGE